MDDKERAIYNNEGVIALARYLDGRHKKLSQATVDFALPQVGAYLTNRNAREEIDSIVAKAIRSSQGETVVVAHSLGTIVALRVLTTLPAVAVMHFFTIGGPLGVRAVVDRIDLPLPLKWPSNVASWTNYFDLRDMVSIGKTVDRQSLFAEVYADTTQRSRCRYDIPNFTDVRNGTSNCHGIDGYLNDPLIASSILHSVAAI